MGEAGALGGEGLCAEVAAGLAEAVTRDEDAALGTLSGVGALTTGSGPAGLHLAPELAPPSRLPLWPGPFPPAPKALLHSLDAEDARASPGGFLFPPPRPEHRVPRCPW